MFYLIGLGLGDEKDITVKGLEAVRSCARVYLEAYTSILTVGKERLEEYYGRSVIVADREMIESSSDEILANADTQDVAMLVVGDPFGATTHTDIVLRARERGIPVKAIHNASIMNAVGCCGLQLYKFGQTVSIVFFTETWRPDSFYDKILANTQAGLHTLCLLDIKVKEPTLESLARGRKVYEPPRFMTVAQAAEQLLEVEEKRKQGGAPPVRTLSRPRGRGSPAAYGPDTLAVGMARVGTDEQRLVCARLKDLASADLGPPLHSLVLAGCGVAELHELEVEYLRQFCSDPALLPPPAS